MALVLVDTNVLVGIIDRTSARHPVAINAVQKLQASGDDLRTASQNLMEFWRVATRPTANNGLGLSIRAADQELTALEGVFPRIADVDSTYAHWRHLVTSVGVSGVQVHDARLVSLMLAAGATHVLTFNVGDFARFIAPAGITVLDPAVV